jgi:alpha-tubulin suppressor-like RCC1 family protein
MMGAGGAAGEPEYELYTFGLNTNGQLGLGDLTRRSSPVQVGALTTWLSVAAGGAHTAAITEE